MEAKEELEALEAIYGDELNWEESGDGQLIVRVSLKEHDQQGAGGSAWYSAYLEFILGPQYPRCPPSKVSLRHARGLNETETNDCLAIVARQFRQSCNNTTTTNKKMDDDLQMDHHQRRRSTSSSSTSFGASHVLYDAIEAAREYLSKRTGPSLPCPICLYGFETDDSMVVTSECSHHFHAYCLARYVEYSRREQEREKAMFGKAIEHKVDESIYCPVCRTVIDRTVESMMMTSRSSSSTRGGGGKDSSSTTVSMAQETPKSWCSAESASSNNNNNNNNSNSNNNNCDWSSLLSNPIQRHYKDLWEKQKRNGGLIDLQREKERFLITENTRLPPPPTTSSTTTANNASSSAGRNQQQQQQPHSRSYS